MRACRWPHSIAALARIQGREAAHGAAPARRAGISVYDDFAHHPTAIATTIEGLRRRVGKARLVAVLEARSNTMRMGVHKDTLAPSLGGADAVYLFAPPDLGWDAGAVAQLDRREGRNRTHHRCAAGAARRRPAQSGDQVLIMSNGGFGGLHKRLLESLQGSRQMSERIALFPLGTVLFPAGVLPLRIFETRYVDMVRRCMRERQPALAWC